jgi:hypothetical protein
LKPKLVRVGRKVGLPNYSSVSIEWEAEITADELVKYKEDEILPIITERLMKNLSEYIREMGWEK